MAWDQAYRRLNEGEIIRESDECMRDKPFGWERDNGRCAGKPAPDPNFTSHRTYRRLKATPTTDGEG